MLSTCSCKNYNSNLYRTYLIAEEKKVDDNISKVVPELLFSSNLKINDEVLLEESYMKYYIEKYYKEVLSKLDAEKYYKKLDDSILLSEGLERYIVAGWLEILLDVRVPEVMVLNGVTEEVSRPEYIKTYLEEIMKNNMNMRGFNSLRAVYLFEQGEKLEEEANRLEEKTGKSYDNYRQMACYLRCDADEVELNYIKNRRVKVKKNINKKD